MSETNKTFCGWNGSGYAWGGARAVPAQRARDVARGMCVSTSAAVLNGAGSAGATVGRCGTVCAPMAQTEQDLSSAVRW